MCSNLLEKISKEERESESGGKEECAAEQRENCVRSLNRNGGLPDSAVRHKNELLGLAGWLNGQRSDLSLISGTYVVEGRTNKLSSDHHTQNK